MKAISAPLSILVSAESAQDFDDMDSAPDSDDEDSGVDAPDSKPMSDVTPDARFTPFVSDAAKVFQDCEAEEKGALEGVKRGGTTLKPPDLSHLGPEKGRLNRLYAAYVQSPTEENLNTLLGEVERYARRVTWSKASQGVTDYASTDISLKVMANVWRSLNKFDGRSEFKTWVFRIASNAAKDEYRASNRREVVLLEWKNYDNEGSGCYRGASAESANGDFNISGGSKISIPSGNAPRRARKFDLEALIDLLTPEDKRIVYLFLDGYTPRELGEHFEKNSKWASNQLNRVKKTLKKLATNAFPADRVAIPRTSSVSVMKGKTLQTPKNLNAVAYPRDTCISAQTLCVAA